MSERAYLLLGPETGAKEQVLKDIRDKLKEAHGGEIELSRFYPFETENGEILTALNNNSLFSDHRMVILSQAEQLGSPMVESIANYLAHPVETATLIIISSELYLSQKIMKAIPKRNIQTFYDLLENQKTDWIRNFFRKLGISITADGIDLLIDLTEDNTQELRLICNQLAIFWQIDKRSRPIEEEDVETYIYHSRQEDAFTLFPLIARGDLKQSMQSLHSILGSGDSQSSILLVNGLLWQFRRLYSLQEFIFQGGNESEAYLQAHVQGKSSPIKKPKDKTTYRNALQRFDLESIRRIIIALGEADLEVKESGSELTDLVLERLLYRIIKCQGNPLNKASFASLI